MSSMASSEDPDEMPHKATFHQGLHCLLRQIDLQKKVIKMFLFLYNTCIYTCTMDHPDLIVSNLLETHRVGGNRKRYQQSTNVDQKSLETVFLIAICRQCGDKWQSKTLLLAFSIATVCIDF